jgi:hypothetical protein
LPTSHAKLHANSHPAFTQNCHIIKYKQYALSGHYDILWIMKKAEVFVPDDYAPEPHEIEVAE